MQTYTLISTGVKFSLLVSVVSALLAVNGFAKNQGFEDHTNSAAPVAPKTLIQSDELPPVDNFVPEMPAEDLTSLRQTAEQGDVIAQLKLGFMYTNGKEVTWNPAEAVHWYTLAAEQGDSIASFNLALMHANGMGVPKNSAEAVKWFRQAAKNGLYVAKYFESVYNARE